MDNILPKLKELVKIDSKQDHVQQIIKIMPVIITHVEHVERSGPKKKEIVILTLKELIKDIDGLDSEFVNKWIDTVDTYAPVVIDQMVSVSKVLHIDKLKDKAEKCCCSLCSAACTGIFTGIAGMITCCVKMR